MASTRTQASSITNWDEVLNRLIATNKNNQRKSLQVLFIATIIFTGSFIFLKHRLAQPISPAAKTQETVSLGLPAPSYAPVLGTTDQLQPTPAPLVYYLSVSAKPPIATLSSLFLADTLVDALDLPYYPNKPYPLKAITFESSTGYPFRSNPTEKFNHHYYVVSQDPDSIKQSYYESDLVRVTARIADKQLLPYLLNNRYCQEDRDCTIRQSYCDQGSFNLFDPFLDSYSCIQSASSSGYSPQLKCPTHLAYSNSRCESQKCTADITQVCNPN